MPRHDTRPSRAAAIASVATIATIATIAATAAALALAVPTAVAQPVPRIKAGLWEYAFEMGSRSGELEKAMKEAQAAMARMPPEQRKMMEQMMAQKGVSLGAGGHKTRLCLTPEDVARDEPPPAQDGCTQKATRSGNTWTMSFQCPARDGEPASSGRGTLTLQSPTAYSGDFTTDTGISGKAEQTRMKMQGRWIAADCGNVKPVLRR